MPTTTAPPANPPVQQSNPQQIALALKQVIESVYTDGISAILKTTQSTDGTITGKFADGPQVYDFSISPDNKITYNEAEATGGRSDSYLIGYTMDSGLGLRGERLDAPVATPGQRTPKCEKGKRCGGACVQQGLACRQTLSPQASQSMVSIRSAIAKHPAVAKANAEASQKANQPTQPQATATSPQKEASSTVPFYQDSKYRSDLIKAGLTTAAVTAVVGGAIHTIQSDLDKSQVNFKDIRQPPGGIPDKETLDYYNTLKPGDLVRKAFTAPGWGARHHYGVYVGKDPKTGEHMMIETTNNLKSKDKTPTVQKNPLTRGVGENSTQYEKVPTENMYRKGAHKMTGDEVVKRAESMLGKTFAYKGFESNCESLARAIVEGKSYSAQGDGVSGFTNVVAGFVTDNASKVKVGKGEKGEGGIRLGSFVIRKTEYGKDKSRMTSAQIADYLNKQVAPRKDADSVSEEPSKASASSATGIADEFFNAAGIQSPKDYEASVELVAQKFPAMADAIRAEMYKKYLLMLFSSTAKGADKKKDSARLDADKGKPCGKGHIASNLKCSIGTSVAPASQALEFDPVFERKLQASGMNSHVVGNVLSGVLGGLTVAGLGAGAAIVTKDFKNASEAVPFDSIRQPPGGVPDEQTLKTYETFQPGDVIRKNFKVPGGAWQHYAIYTGKDPETKEGKVIEVGHSLKDGAIDMRVRTSSILNDADEESTDFEKVPDKELYPGGIKPFTPEEIVARAKAFNGQKFSYQGFESNCESFARGIVTGNPTATQRERITAFSNAVSMLTTEAALRVKRTKEGLALSDYNGNKERMTAAQMIQWLERDKENRRTDAADSPLLPLPSVYASAVEVLAQKFPALADNIRVDLYKRYFLAMFALSSPSERTDKADKGKPCGKGHIAAELKCRIGQTGSDLEKEKSSTTKSVAIDPKIAAIVAGAALIGMPAIAYASSVRSYRQGFAKSAEEIDGMSKEFESKIKKDAVDRTGKPENELTREDIYAVDRYASGSDKKRTFSVDPKKPYITFTVGGLNDHGEDGTGMAVTLKKTLGKDSIIPLTNKKVQITPEDTWLPMNDLLDDTLDPDGKGGSVERGFLARRGATNALKTLLGEKYPDVLKGIRESKNYTTVEPVARVAIRSLRDITMLSKNAIKNGENADAKDIAAQMLAFHKAYPDKPLRIVAHSGGGAAAAEAAEILNRKGVKTQVANIGTPFFGLTKLPPDQLITIASTGDYMMKLPAQNRVAVSDVTAHTWVGHAGSQGYGGSAEVKSALRQFLYGEKPSQKKTDDATDTPSVQKFVAALLKPAIRQVYSDVSQVANVELKGTGVTGIFSDSNGDVFQFEITSSGQLTYKAATRKDAEQDQCEKGMQCGSSCVPQGDQCNSGLSDSGQAIAQLAIKTLKTEELPSRLEVARAMGTATKGFLRNPVKALKEGVQREAAVREAIQAQTGVIVPSQTAILKKAGQKMTGFVKDLVKKNAEDGLVNTAGLAASIAGGAVAGPIGALAGDLGGALATRKAITDYKALQRARLKLADDEAFKSAGALSKLKILGAATLAELKSPAMQKRIEDDATGDVAGWAIGNASAVTLTAMGVNIPLKGAAVAIATVPSVVKAHRRIREGKSAAKKTRRKS